MSSKHKILEYLKANLREWVHNQKLREISGANDTPRTIRALRQEGWQIEVKGDGYNRLLSLEKSEAKGIRKSISEKLRYRILNRDNHRCRSCGRGPQDGVKLVVDHVVPVDWGGLTEENNLQTLCEECNRGKKAWISGQPLEKMKKIMSNTTVESRIETLFDAFPNEDIPSYLIQLVSKGAFDWQRALRRIRQKAGKKIEPTLGRTAYRYYKK